ncbi:MAG: hypothetical protein J6X99_05460 [Bacteroidales bacterium]|nr:hypothetical protein [Bacteroidales bacterium]
MRKNAFWIVYVMLLLGQLLISNYFTFTPYITLSILPVMVLCISTSVSTPATMIIAFLTGLAVDWLSEGVLGLNAIALVPVAYIRKPVIQFIFGNSLSARKEDFTVQSNGQLSVMVAILAVQAVFLAIYIWVDGAGMRPFWFNVARFFASLAAGLLVSVFTLTPLASDNRR